MLEWVLVECSDMYKHNGRQIGGCSKALGPRRQSGLQLLCEEVFFNHAACARARVRDYRSIQPLLR